MSGLATLLVAAEDPDLRPELDPYDVSPGLVGFLVMFVIALACILLFLSLTKHLRRSKHNESLRDREAHRGDAEDGPGQDDDGTDATNGAARARDGAEPEGSSDADTSSGSDDD
ncbi:hypothetical protein [Paraoerskovia marina]|uniref:hypothetical protein n=1 Tax=Paraoerskovia marina TaxID=545619 RepID=UPI0005B7F172|nr:hypothetical protein [Paraoerskovia marina]